jgi:nitroimidazol reductase NimA-like FMN-containing flavoprotein (pyridoxamine 5'-phosphate oxidase superfamily)
MSEDRTPSPDDIGRRVRHRRLDLGMTIEEVAERAGMAPTFVGYLEGQPATLGIDTLIRLADALRTSVNALLDGPVQAPPKRKTPSQPRGFEHLEPDECVRLIAAGGVGRVAFTTESGPVALPVNYEWAQGAVIFRTASGSLLATHAGVQVGFEVDRIDRPLRAGWSVLVSGVAQVVTEPELCRLRPGVNVEPWVPGPHDVYVSINPERITGRRIRATDVMSVDA